MICLVTLVLCNIPDSLEHEIPRRSFLSRRAIDGTRGRKYFDPEEEGAFDSYGSAGGQYDPYEEKTDLSDIRRNVPGEPGVDYPAYTTLPQTGFTCEGRSRGYYADEVAGCQVFHVCHDVLVSSFLCPIGSIFSQKLLTCDWWTKVDCSSSEKYIDVNRNSYQQDDDEMIRNAYAMISLQSGTDVTKDGLVDPDRTGSVVDYQRGPGRNLDYSSVDPTGNDLRSNYEDYSGAVSRNFLPPYRPKDRKLETSRSYQERFYSSEKSKSPYEDSPIIRVQNIKGPDYGDQNRDFQGSYQRPNEFTNQFQPSYAPTVPTVTTTTRRFYSPTVPTTFRPSTLAYNKLDQVIDSSDYYFSHSRTKGFVTPPTRSFENKDRQSPRRSNDKQEDVPRKDYGQQDSYEDDYENSEEERQAPSGERFQVRVAEDYRVNRTGLLFDQVYRGFRTRDEDEILDDIETRGSIGLGHALSNSFRGISVQQQNPVNSGVKDEGKYTLSRTEPTVFDNEEREETTEQYQRNDQRDQGIAEHREEDFVPSTTPSVIESTIKATTNLHELNTSGISIDSNYSDADQKHSIDRVDKFLRPPEEPRSKFQINVPDLTEVSTLLIRYSSVDDGPRTGTESPRFQDTYPDDYVDSTANDEAVTEQNYPSTEDRHSSGELKTTVPYRDVSSVVNYSESDFEGLLLNRYQSDLIQVSNKSEVESNSNSGRQSLQNFTACSSPGESSCEKNTQGQINSSSPRSTTDRFAETLTPRSNEEIRTSAVTQSPIIDSTSEPVHRSTEDETSTTLIKSIRPETLKQIEESIEKNNSPYHVTLTVNKGEELAPTGDFIGKLIAQQGKESSTVNDKLHQLEIIKSVEPEIVTDPPVTTANIVNADQSNTESFSKVEQNPSRNKNFNTVSLLQLMSELLKLDRAPRPFALPGAHNLVPRTQPEIPSTSTSKTIAKEINQDIQEVTEKFQENSTDTRPDIRDQFRENFSGPLLKNDGQFSQGDRPGDFQKEKGFGTTVADAPVKDHIKEQLSLTDQGLELPRKDTIIHFQKDSNKDQESNFRTTVSDLKDRIKDQLSQNFGEPLLKTDHLSQKDTITPLDHLPTNKDNQESTNPRTTIGSSVSTSRSSTIITTTPQTSTTDGKTVVKTEFVPSIGFSFDTDEGREEYVEAVLGGLIEPEAAESEKKESVLSKTQETSSKKNETLKDA
ncbi:uncharacterized protein LOC100883311 isoform X2 [Megachile rotundata]|uniref:uncharacterized protein LOC100883311 isoform X2 n=1 Tax=Megachile rotundata TaxID=143995 RepID=UPI003FD5178D